MPTNISTIIINAPLQKVWEVITTPEAIKQWQFGSDLSTDWKTGSDIQFSTVWEGVTYLQWGKVLEVKLYELVRYSLFAPRPDLEDLPENYFEMCYVLTPEYGQTKLEIIQKDNRPGAAQEAPQGEENPILQTLKKLAENQ